MLEIKIADRFRPFSHLFGTKVLIPKTDVQAEIFPTLIKVGDKELYLELNGPFKNFTVQKDLEKGFIEVSGKAKEGFFRYRLMVRDKTLYFDPTKWPYELKPKVLLEAVEDLKSSEERLSFGASKKQDIEMILRRMDAREILPLWHRMSLFYPKGNKEHPLLKEASELVKKGEKESALELLEMSFQSSFSSLLFPSNRDLFYQKILDGEIDTLSLIQEGAEVIRSFFLQKKEDQILLLPALPKKVPFGRFVKFFISDFGYADLEWSKGKLRRANLHPIADGSYSLVLPKGQKSFRLRKGKKDPGKRFTSAALLTLSKDESYYLDQVQQ